MITIVMKGVGRLVLVVRAVVMVTPEGMRMSAGLVVTVRVLPSPPRNPEPL